MTGLFGALLPNRYKWGELSCHLHCTVPSASKLVWVISWMSSLATYADSLLGNGFIHAGWFGIGCLFMVFIMWGLLFHARRAAFQRSAKVSDSSYAWMSIY